jgi:hypothetical protein
MIENGAGALASRGALNENGATGANILEQKSDKKSSSFFCCRVKPALFKQVSR